MFSQIVRQGRVIAIGTVLFSTVALVRCTMSTPKVGLQLEVDSVALKKRLQGTTLSHLSCFFVSVTGPGVSYDFASLELGSRNPACMGFGRTSNLATLNDFGAANGVRMSLAAGQKRLIRIFGASTSISDCTNRPLKDLFTNKTPFIYEVASTEVDLFVDKKVTITGTNDLAQVQDVVAPCDNTGGDGGGGIVTGLPSAAKLAVTMSTASVAGTRIFAINSELALSREGLDFPHADIPGFAGIVQPNGRSFYLHANAPTTMVKRFEVGDGVITAPPSGEMSFLGQFYPPIFSANSNYAYAFTAGAFYQLKTESSGAWSDPGHGTCSASSIVAALNSTHYFEFSYNAAGVRTFSGNGNLCPAHDLSAGTPGPYLGTPVAAKFGPNGRLYVLDRTDGGNESSIQVFNPSVNGTWLSRAGSLVINTASVTDFQLDPLGRFVLTASQSVPLGISVYALDAVGIPIGPSLSTGPVGAIDSLVMDPLGRGVFAVQAGSQVKGFKLSDVGILTPVDYAPNPDLAADYIYTLTPVPIRN